MQAQRKKDYKNVFNYSFLLFKIMATKDLNVLLT